MLRIAPERQRADRPQDAARELREELKALNNGRQVVRLSRRSKRGLRSPDAAQRHSGALLIRGPLPCFADIPESAGIPYGSLCLESLS
jgi:hypothetical protein